MLLSKFSAVFVGIAQGISVGTAFAAFITILDIVYRLVQITNTDKYIRLYEKFLIAAFPITSILVFLGFKLILGRVIAIIAGLFMGIFIGMLASALAEVLNVIPVLVNRFDMNKYVHYILMSLILGKMLGSLVYWIKLN